MATKTRRTPDQSYRKYNKPLRHVVDDQVKKGGSWKRILANVNRVATRRDMPTFTKNKVIKVINRRLAKDELFYGGKVVITDKGVKIDSK